MKKGIFIIIIFVFIFLLIFGTLYIYSSNQNQNSTDKLKEKVDAEIKYLEDEIILMMSELNNVQSIDDQSSITNMNQNDTSILNNKQVDYEDVKKDIENMYQTWNTTIIDLNSLGVKQDDLLKYTTYLGNATNAIKSKNKKSVMYNLADLYSLLVSYTKDYSNDNKKIILLSVKSNILYSYALIEDTKWNEMKNYIQKAQTVYSELMNGAMPSDVNPININKSYILLNELSKSVDLKNKDSFYINYRNLIDELEIIF